MLFARSYTEGFRIPFLPAQLSRMTLRDEGGRGTGDARGVRPAPCILDVS
jgi:hypothetical protein